MTSSQNKVLKVASQIVLVTLGILSAGLGIKGFLLPNHFIDGGVTGMSMLVSKVSGIELPFLLLAINAPFLFFGFNQIGKGFAVYSALTILGLALALIFVDYPSLTHDKLLASIFGGFFLGAGIGLSIRGSTVLDGTEVLALIISKKMGVTVGDVILIFNLLIFSFGALILGIEPALYSILTYFSASRTVDFLLHGIEGYNGVTIISSESEQIRLAIINQTGRGVTVYRGKGGFSNSDKDILFCVITRLEIPKIRSIVNEIDPLAFVFTNNLSDASGGMVKKKSGVH